MSTQPAERHVRVCPQHGVAVQETANGKLICPKGWHPVGKFRVVDTLKHRVVEASVDGEGMEEMSSSTRPAAITPPKSSTKKTECMQAAKFVDPVGAVLLLRLSRKRTVRNGDVFVVWWRRDEDMPFSKKRKSTSGTLHHGAYAEHARTEFAKAAGEATADGWSEKPLQSHSVKFLPLPKPAPALDLPTRGPGPGKKGGR